MKSKRFLNIGILAIPALLLSACTQQEKMSVVASIPAADNSESLSVSFGIFDSDNDGIVDPYEVLDALLILEKQLGRKPSKEDLAEYATQKIKQAETEEAEFISSHNSDENGVITLSNVDEGDRGFLAGMDSDGDGLVTLSEYRNFDPLSEFRNVSEESLQAGVDNLFKQLDANGNDIIELPEEAGKDRLGLGRLSQRDLNRDNQVTREEAYIFQKGYDSLAEFTVNGNTAYMNGIISSAFPATVLRLLFEHPQVETIEMQIAPGSIADDANVRAAMYVHDHGLTTKVTAGSSIASGGTDFFMAGTVRIVEPGAILGVHSWGGGGVPAAEVPREDPVHQLYLDFYDEVDVPQDFYWYTLEMATAEQMHIMTEEEIEQYEVRKN